MSLDFPAFDAPRGGALAAALREFTLSRRTFLGSGLALALSRRMPVPAPSRDDTPFTTFVNLRGGNDALNTLVPTRVPEYPLRRPLIAIAPEAGASLAEGPYATTDYVLHPALANIARLYRAGEVACVRAVGYPNHSQSHFLSQDVWSRGYRQERTRDSGWIARFKDLYAPEPTGVVALGLGSQLDFQGGETPSTHTLESRGGNVNYRFEGDPSYPANDRLRLAVVDRVLATPRTDVAGERVRLAQVAAIEQARRDAAGNGNGNGGRARVEYPATGLGFGLWAAADLRLAGFPAAVYYCNHGDFDTHAAQGGATGRHGDQLRELDLAIDAYARDLREAGAWARTVILVFSEFGRRNASNSSGTDHGEGGLLLAIGGAVRGGMYGPELTSELVMAPVLPVGVDFRSVYHELLADHLAVDPAPVFDEPFLRTSLGLFR